MSWGKLSRPDRFKIGRGLTFVSLVLSAFAGAEAAAAPSQPNVIFILADDKD